MVPAFSSEEQPGTDYVHFVKTFWKARGAVALLLITTLVSFGSGCVIGVVGVCVSGVCVSSGDDGCVLLAV